MEFSSFNVDKTIQALSKIEIEKLEKLNLGAGDDVRVGWHNHDQVPSKYIEYTFDLNKHPYKIEDSKFDIVYASHVLEHVLEIFTCIEEIHRILKKDGLFIVRTPHYSSNFCYMDLSHRRATGYLTFQQIADKYYCHLYNITKWSSIEYCKLFFAKKWYYPWNYVIEPIANLKPIYFENTLANLFTPFETVTILKK